jgi:hypothetical protein
MTKRIDIIWNVVEPRSDCPKWFGAGNRALVFLTIFKKGC